VKRKRSWPNLRNYPAFFCRSEKASAKILGVLTGIRREHLPKHSLIILPLLFIVSLLLLTCPTEDYNWGQYRNVRLQDCKTRPHFGRVLPMNLLLDLLYQYTRNTLSYLANETVTSTAGRVIAQAVSRRLPTAAARVQTQVWLCGIL
jgi:hypothetical protein